VQVQNSSTPYGELVIFSGQSIRPTAEAIAKDLGVSLGTVKATQFPDTESYVRLEENVRGADVFIVQSTCTPVNDNYIELLIMIDALRRASAARITVIMPYMGYARQDRKATGREPISSKLMADLITTAGADRVVSVDLHNSAIQGFFNIPLDHLTAIPALASELMGLSLVDPVLVSPDAGRAKMVEKFQQVFDVPLVIMHKRRKGAEVSVTEVIGDVKDRTPILIDDIMASGSIITQVDALVQRGARPEVYMAITHPVLCGNAVDRLQHPALKALITTDTITIPPERMTDKIRVVSLAPMLADVIKRIHLNQSVSEVFTKLFEEFPV
jgi:ribose-phosphate pyrophosphokinase